MRAAGNSPFALLNRFSSPVYSWKNLSLKNKSDLILLAHFVQRAELRWLWRAEAGSSEQRQLGMWGALPFTSTRWSRRDPLPGL